MDDLEARCAAICPGCRSNIPMDKYFTHYAPNGSAYECHASELREAWSKYHPEDANAE